MWNKIKNFFMGLFDVNKDGKITAEDLSLAQAVAEEKYKQANEKINEVVEKTEETVKEVKTRAKRVKEEVKDVAVAAKEVVNQAGDVIKAVKGKQRKGRKKK